jgi:hypothetical protein
MVGDNMRRKIIIIGILISLFIGAWLLYSALQPPVWIGESSDAKWKAVYDRSFIPKDIWEGTLIWNEEDQVTVTFYQHYLNGQQITGQDSSTLNEINKLNETNKLNKYSFVRGEQRTKSDDLKIVIGWKQNNGEEQIEEITLKPRKRLLFIPKIKQYTGM